MPRDCPYDRCYFFVDAGAAWCPGCGRALHSFDAAWMRAHRRPLGLAGVGLAVLALVTWQVLTGWLGAALVLAVCSTAVLAWVVASRRRPRQSAARSLDAQYQLAVYEAERWLETWSELFARSSDLNGLVDDERQLVIEAQVAAADAATESCRRRDKYAGRYICNGFDRLRVLDESQRRRPTADWATQRRRAISTVEHYLETLWIDHQSIDQARVHLKNLQAEQARHVQQRDLYALTSTVRLLEPLPGDSQLAASREMSGSGDDVIAAELHRLRAERELFRDAPQL